MYPFQKLQGATGFPDSDDVNPYGQCRNRFDYRRWDAGTNVKLCSVPFDCIEDYPAWESMRDRDLWFSGIEGYTLTIQDSMRIVSDGIKVPVPFDASGMYNYAWVTLPRLTSEAEPLDNESVNGIRHWGFFVTDIEFRSPSVTMLNVVVDWWGTFFNRASVNGVMLSRGHYALAHAASVSDYLADPVSHTDWLSGTETTDVRQTNRRTVANVVLNDGAIWAVLVCDSLPSGAWGDASDPRVSTLPHLTDYADTLPSASVLAVPAADLDAFLGGVPGTFPQTVRGLYLVDGRWLRLGDAFQFGGVTCRHVLGGGALSVDVLPDMDEFGYPSEYAGITKLYTAQFATLEVVTDRGQTIPVRIEDLGRSARLDVRSQVADAGMVIRAVLVGAGGDEVREIGFANLAKSSVAGGGSWLDRVLTWDVPCYAIWQGAGERYDATHKHAFDTALANAQRTYGAATNSNAAAAQNAVDSAQTSHDNAVRSADAARANTNDTAATQLANANAAADAAKANSDAQADNVQTNADNSATNITDNNAVAVAASTANNTANVNAATQGATASTTKLTLDVTSDLNSSYAALQADQSVVSITMSNNDARSQTATTNNTISGVTGLANAALSMVGAGVSGNAGGILSGIGGAISTVGSTIQNSNTIATDWQTANASALVTASNNQALYQAGVTNSTEKGAHANTYTTTSTQISNTAKTTVTNNNNDASTKTADNNAAVTRQNAANSANTMRNIATRNQVTEKANASRNNATMTGNATRTHDMQTGNADATLATATSNARRSQAAADNSALQAMTNSQASTTAARNDAYAQAPVQSGQCSNGGTAATLPMVAQVRIDRSSDAEVRVAGDMMLRYGYVCHRYVRSPDLNQMRHFTYWQCSDAWVSPSGECPEVAANAIRDALRRGCTLWKNPSEIGTISLFDN